jgi:hypothetical protein
MSERVSVPAFSQRLWLFVALRQTGLNPSKLALAMEGQLRCPVNPKVIERVLDGESRLTAEAMLAASIVTGVPLEANVRVAA